MKIPKSFLIFASLLIATICVGQKNNFLYKVESSDHFPVADCKLELKKIKNKSIEQSTITNSKGEAQFQKFNKKKYQFFISSEKFNGISPIKHTTDQNKISLNIPKKIIDSLKKVQIISSRKSWEVLQKEWALFDLKYDTIKTTKGKPNKTSKGITMFEVVNKPAEYIGGFPAMNKFISENIIYPFESKKRKDQEKIYVGMIIRSDGKISNVTIRKGENKILCQEAIRVIRLMPDWIPGEQKGKKIDTHYTIPITFRLD